MGSIHTMEYDSAMKRSDTLTQATTWMDLEHTMLSERSQTQKDTQCVIPLIGNVQNRQIHRHKVGSWLPGAGGGGWGVTAHGVRGSVWGEQKALKLDRGSGCTALYMHFKPQNSRW